jgi:hypothetical protein
MNTTNSSSRSGSPTPAAAPALDRGSWIILQCRLDRVDHSGLDQWIDEKLDALEDSMDEFQTNTSLKKTLRRERRPEE